MKTWSEINRSTKAMLVTTATLTPAAKWDTQKTEVWSNLYLLCISLLNVLRLTLLQIQLTACLDIELPAPHLDNESQIERARMSFFLFGYIVKTRHGTLSGARSILTDFAYLSDTSRCHLNLQPSSVFMSFIMSITSFYSSAPLLCSDVLRWQKEALKNTDH